MKTYHQIIFDSIENINLIEGKVNLIVTSPPYPMIEMWDNLFSNKDIEKLLLENRCNDAHYTMCLMLANVLVYCRNILEPGGIICLNIGDATRTINKNFRLYNNHSLLITILHALGLEQLPSIIWRKPTNAPNKFMGSGTLPVKAYVTLEHEYILIFRKGIREFTKEENIRRKRSAFFYEERNIWFSDLWEIRGAPQSKNGLRTAAYPFEIPYRLINMFSIQGDTVLDPFLGSGTTTNAAIASGRNSIGFEVNRKLGSTLYDTIDRSKEIGVTTSHNRLAYHTNYIKQRKAKYKHKSYGPVVTQSETKMALPILKNIKFERKADVFKFEVLHKFL